MLNRCNYKKSRSCSQGLLILCHSFQYMWITLHYNADTNVLEWVQYPEDTAETRTEYSYDALYRLATAETMVDSGYSLAVEYGYTDDLLTSC